MAQALISRQYVAEVTSGARGLDAALALRSLVFRGGGDDRDGFDARCEHMIVRDITGRVVACARLLLLEDGRAMSTSYAAQFYDLTRLQSFAQPMAELGRFCVHPDHSDADILRVIWGALTKIVDAKGIEMIFGCTSFSGASIAGREAAFGYLADKYLAPARYRPGVGFDKTVPLLRSAVRDRLALGDLPPLLRTYLSMGAWVSDHAVIDEDLDTLHVFTGLEISKVPESRKRLLRRLG